MSRSPASYENNLRLSREAKRRRTGSCRVCGAETRYGGRAGVPVSEMCQACADRERGAKMRGKGELQRRVLLYLRKPRRAIEIAERFGISQHHAGNVLNRLRRYGLVRRVSRGVYERAE